MVFIRKRSRVGWLLKTLAATVCLAVLQAPATGNPSLSPASKAIEYVTGTQAGDGSFFGGDQSVAFSGGLADTLVSLAADWGLKRGSSRTLSNICGRAGQMR